MQSFRPTSTWAWRLLRWAALLLPAPSFYTESAWRWPSIMMMMMLFLFVLVQRERERKTTLLLTWYFFTCVTYSTYIDIKTAMKGWLWCWHDYQQIIFTGYFCWEPHLVTWKTRRDSEYGDDALCVPGLTVHLQVEISTYVATKRAIFEHLFISVSALCTR